MRACAKRMKSILKIVSQMGDLHSSFGCLSWRAMFFRLICRILIRAFTNGQLSSRTFRPSNSIRDSQAYVALALHQVRSIASRTLLTDSLM